MLQSQAPGSMSWLSICCLRRCKNSRKLLGFQRNYSNNKTPRILETPVAKRFVVSAMKKVLNCLRAEAELGNIKLLQVNNRFERPTSDNWQAVAVGSLVVGQRAPIKTAFHENIGIGSQLDCYCSFRGSCTAFPPTSFIVALERWDGNSYHESRGWKFIP